MYYIEERTMKEIGQALSVNESRVSQIHKSALSKLHEYMTACGIHGEHVA
jgi:RNA polymerase sigma factor for flagellar operon FliA